MKIIGGDSCAIYILDRNYIKAAEGIFAEYLRSGVPIAALSWKGNDSPYASIDNRKTGKIFLATKNMREDEIIDGLTKCVRFCLKLDKKKCLSMVKENFLPICWF